MQCRVSIAMVTYLFDLCLCYASQTDVMRSSRTRTSKFVCKIQFLINDELYCVENMNETCIHLQNNLLIYVLEWVIRERRRGLGPTLGRTRAG